MGDNTQKLLEAFQALQRLQALKAKEQAGLKPSKDDCKEMLEIAKMISRLYGFEEQQAGEKVTKAREHLFFVRLPMVTPAGQKNGEVYINVAAITSFMDNGRTRYVSMLGEQNFHTSAPLSVLEDLTDPVSPLKSEKQQSPC